MAVQNSAWLSSTTAAASGAGAARTDSIESPGRFAALLDRAQDAPARGRDSALGNAFEVREAQRPAPQAPREAVKTPEAAAARAQDAAPKPQANAPRANADRPREPQRPNAERSSQRSSETRGEQGQTDSAAAADAEATTDGTAAATTTDGASTPALPAAAQAGSTDLMNWLDRLAAQAEAGADADFAQAMPGAAQADAGAVAGTGADAAGADLGAAVETMAHAMLAGTAVPGAASDAAAPAAARIETAALGAAAPTQQAAPAQRGHEAAATREVQVPVPLESPEFPQVLSSQISSFAREGIHEAQLMLNPAEMGPVAVRIVVDGKDAQVNFHAAQATTRSALEASLPTLAASLQDAGLTLSGGGVFDQSAQQQPGGERQGGGGRRFGGGDAGEDMAVAGRGVRHDRPRGLLDTYA